MPGSIALSPTSRKITGEIMPSLISGNMRADFIPANVPIAEKNY